MSNDLNSEHLLDQISALYLLFTNIHENRFRLLCFVYPWTTSSLLGKFFLGMEI